MSMRTETFFEGIPVEFPYTPYSSQKTYISKLVKALLTGSNALLESPTGTGKTLCLLCGALAWQQAVMKGVVPHPSQIKRKQQSSYLNSVQLEPVTDEAAQINPKKRQLTEQNDNTSSKAWNTLHAMIDLASNNPTDSLPNNAFHSSNENTSTVQSLQSHRKYPISGVSGGSSGAQIPTIYFASRTHSQLAQVVEELRKTSYISSLDVLDSQQDTQGITEKPDYFQRTEQRGDFNPPEQHREISPSVLTFKLKMTVMASRDHLCIHPELTQLKGSALTAACQQKLKIHSCHFEGGLSRFKSDALTHPRDIEDLRLFGRRNGYCPYYAAKEHSSECHLILLPYEYLLSSAMRKQLKFQLKDSVIIFDEGHNIERVAEDSGSFEFSLSTLMLACESLTNFSNDQSIHFEEFTTKDIVEKLLIPLTQLKHFIESKQLNPSTSDFNSPHLILPGGDLLAMLERCGFTAANISLYDIIVSKCGEWLLSDNHSNLVEALHFGRQRTDAHADTLQAIHEQKALEQVVGSLTIAFNASRKQLDWFRLYIHEKSAQPEGYQYSLKQTVSKQKRISLTGTILPQANNDRILSFWCFNAGCMLLDLVTREAVHSLIVTSGTLSPMDSYAATLGGYGDLEFSETLENDHVIQPDRVGLEIISCYKPPSPPFRFVYQNKDNQDLAKSLGNVVIDICKYVPGGVLIFFSSYAQLSSITDTWKTCEVWTMLCSTRKVIIEPSANSTVEFAEVISTYCESIKAVHPSGKNKKNGVLLAVIRGRISEGMNLTDDLCRCVVIVGVPHPSMTDPRLKLKQQVLDIIHPGKNKGFEWYLQQAGRAINQAIGRVIRHQHDYGLIILIDERFTFQKQFLHLSRWVRNTVSQSVHRQKPYQDILHSIQTFFTRVVPKSVLQHSVPSRSCYQDSYTNGGSSISTNDSWLNSSTHTVSTRLSSHSFMTRPLCIQKKKLKLTRESSLKKKSRIIPQYFTITEICDGDSLLASRSNHVESQSINEPIFNNNLPVSLGQSALTAKDNTFSLSSIVRQMSQLPKINNDLIKTNSEIAMIATEEPHISQRQIFCALCCITKPEIDLRQSIRCNHRACLKCWYLAFERQFQCPFCQKTTRLEHLKIIK